jgi:serine/threonine-protein kinase HipA
VNALEVRLGSVRVGLLERFDDEAYVFSFDPGWLTMPDRPVLGQIFEDFRPREMPTSGLPCWFAHLLPQGPLRRVIARQAGVGEGDRFDLLAALGHDLPGAVELRPAGSRSVRAPPSPAPALPAGSPLRFSLAGAQWKLSVRQGDRGLTAPVIGESGHAIAKFQDPTYPGLPRVEFATMSWAAATGVRVPPFRRANLREFEALPDFIPTSEGEAFVIDRFDREKGGARIHIEDFGQVLDHPPGDPQYHGKYEHLGAVLSALCPQDFREFVERLAFCALCGNTDAHLKNWSLIYPDGRTPRLSPAYDLVASVLYVPPLDDGLALELAGRKRFENIDGASFRPLADACGFSFELVGEWARSTAERARAAFRDHASDWGFTDRERERLAAHQARVPL